jgi:DNA-binding response OmpR family regulator
VDTVARSATKAGVPVASRPGNSTFWNSFCATGGAALYRDVLFERVWGGEMDDGTRTLDCTSSACAKSWVGRSISSRL